MVKSKRRKSLSKILLVAILCPLLVCNVPLPVQRELSAVAIKLDDPGYCEVCTIQLSGWYNINLFREDTFYGQVSVSDYPWTKENMISPLSLGETESLLEYRKRVPQTGPKPSIQHQEVFEYALGHMRVGFYMTKPIIFVFANNTLDKSGGAVKRSEGGYEGAWGAGAGYDCIVAGAADRDQAMEILAAHHVFPPDES